MGRNIQRVLKSAFLAVMIVNSENLNLVDGSDDFQLLVQRIESMRGHREYFNRGD